MLIINLKEHLEFQWYDSVVLEYRLVPQNDEKYEDGGSDYRQ